MLTEVLEPKPAVSGGKIRERINTIETFYYDNKIVRNFACATIFWGLAGMLIGVIIAFQLARPELNMGTQYTTFGRIRPLAHQCRNFCLCG